MKPAFEKYWLQFAAFLKEQRLSECKSVQCEVTYVNHIPKGQGWDSIEDWHNVFDLCGECHGQKFLPPPETRRFDRAFQLPDGRGRLHVNAAHGIRNSDGGEIISLKLTARGKPVSPKNSDVMAWLDLGREWVVRGFADITTSKMHEMWKGSE